MNRYLTNALPMLIDGATLLLLLRVVDPLSTRFVQPSGLNSLLLIGVYVLFLVGVFLLRKLEPLGENGRSLILGTKTRGVLALFFGLVMMTAVSYQLGYFDVFLQVGATELDEGASSSLFVYGPSAWLFLSMFYVFVLAFPVTPRISPSGNGYIIATLLGLMGSQGLLLIAVGQLRAIATLFSLSGALWFLEAVLLLALLFAPPRLLYAQKQAVWLSVVTFAVLLLACGIVIVIAGL